MASNSPLWLRIVQHVGAGLVALAFLGAGGSKLAGVEAMVTQFAGWGLPPWFMTFTGAVEVLGAVLLALPWTRFYGGLLLVATMIGATGVHLVNGEIGGIVGPVVLGTASAALAWPARPAVLRGGASTSEPVAAK